MRTTQQTMTTIEIQRTAGVTACSSTCLVLLPEFAYTFLTFRPMTKYIFLHQINILTSVHLSIRQTVKISRQELYHLALALFDITPELIDCLN